MRGIGAGTKAGLLHPGLDEGIDGSENPGFRLGNRNLLRDGLEGPVGVVGGTLPDPAVEELLLLFAEREF